jgi:hypothetical protein
MKKKLGAKMNATDEKKRALIRLIILTLARDAEENAKKIARRSHPCPKCGVQTDALLCPECLLDMPLRSKDGKVDA